MFTYDELKAKATSPSATTEDRKALFVWLENNDQREWNGESFPLEDGKRLYPIYEEVFDEDGDLRDIILIDARID